MKSTSLVVMSWGMFFLAPAGCMEGPTNGQTFAGSTVGQVLNVSGRVSTANIPITVQVLTSPAADPAVDSNWVTLATPTSSSTGLTWNDPNPFYMWNASVIPVPTAAEQLRWPQGGLARMRATMPTISGPFTLTTFDEDRVACYGARLNESWLDIGRECASPYGQQPLIVSTTPSPADAPVSPGYLTLPSSNANSAPDYYTTIGAPTTLAGFRSTFGFGERITIGHLDNDETSAVYFNRDDLGLAREMHCKTFAFLFGDSGEACYVTNYALRDSQNKVIFSDPVGALPAAIAHDQSKVIATVAMVYSNGSAANHVRFMVYDQNGALTNRAELDSRQANTAVPNNCMTCHGGTGVYNATTHSITNAHFLPFDPGAFDFSTMPGFTKADQQEKFRRMNFMVLNTGPTAAITDLVSGMYLPSSFATPGATVNESFVPQGWMTTPATIKLYDNVIRHNCRTCHVSQTGFTDWGSFTSFTMEQYMATYVCSPGSVAMPHAEVPSRRYWNSGARAHLLNAMNLHLACAP